MMALINRFILSNTVLYFFGLISNLNAQSEVSNLIHPTFESFKGVVYNMPNIRHKVGDIRKNALQEYYSDTIYSYDKIREIELDSINIKLTNIKRNGFPGIQQRTKFAMLLHSKMTINNSGCFVFNLSSDDGSRLWINEQQIINNDGGHGMRTKKDTIYLNQGKYDVKLWYFQGYPDKLGFIFNSKYIDENKSCKTLEKDPSDNILSKKATRKSFNSLLFHSGDFNLTEIGKQELKEYADYINTIDVTTISIFGHTDDIGTLEDNLKLSIKRSEEVKKMLKRQIKDNSVQYKVFGRGANDLLDKSRTLEARRKNRRVEIIVK